MQACRLLLDHLLVQCASPNACNDALVKPDKSSIKHPKNLSLKKKIIKHDKLSSRYKSYVYVWSCMDIFLWSNWTLSDLLKDKKCLGSIFWFENVQKYNSFNNLYFSSNWCTKSYQKYINSSHFVYLHWQINDFVEDSLNFPKYYCSLS